MNIKERVELITKQQMQKQFACGRTLMQNKINEGLAPKPVSRGSRGVAFYQWEVNATIAAMGVYENEGDLRSYISKVVSRRSEVLAEIERLDSSILNGEISTVEVK